MADENGERPTVRRRGDTPDQIAASLIDAMLSRSDIRWEIAHAIRAAVAFDWKWLCEFCYMRAYSNLLPASWELVFQSAVCPDCQRRVRDCGGYAVVPVGLFAEVPDPRAPSSVGRPLEVAAAHSPQGVSGP